jgi:two-component system, OmpR family, KDP operon response regulator KdpE
MHRSNSDMLLPDQPVILVVDDDPDVRQVLRWTLEDAGFAVHTARDGTTAVERAEVHTPSLVILDYGLPNSDGVVVASRLRQICGDRVPVLVMTADGRAAEKAERAGAYAYLHKPFEDEQLITAVRTGLGQT